MEELVQNKLVEKLKIDLKKESEKIENFISSEVERLGRDGVVIGLSGGLDSSTVAYLCKKVLGKEKILALILPEKDSNPRNIEDARIVAKELDLIRKEIDLTSFFEEIGIYTLSIEKISQDRKLIDDLISENRKLVDDFIKTSKELPSGFPNFYGKKNEFEDSIEKLFPGYTNEMAALITAKTRLRMIFLHYYAALNHYLVIGTSDKSEWNIGYYDGDAIVQIQPLLHLYKTQIRQLASYLGVPKNIIEKTSSADLFGIGLPNEVLIGLSYELLDSILYGLDHQYSAKEIITLTGAKEEQIEAVVQLVAADKIRKSLPSFL